MEATMITAGHRDTLDDEEWRIVCAMRELPDSRLTDSFRALLRALADFVADPHCSEMQANGMPCADAHGACAACRKAASILTTLRERLR
jgi:hypothetical protein